ncbi:pentapeptide repeat-containing protein [Sorangium sp. So ce1182]|uniref:pentapeptide repeat-containing protein n=1 Tax=Sorangium sp. So ce1182 TaxID=3133334 RepID=UPI003F616143
MKERSNLLEEYQLGQRDFDRASLEGAQLAGVVLDDARLPHANLDGADLSRASLRGVDLEGASLVGAKLDGADLRGCKLAGADLTGASLLRSKLRGSDLRRAKLSGADLRGADLRHAGMAGVDLSGARVWGSKIAGATLSGAVIRRTLGWISLEQPAPAPMQPEDAGVTLGNAQEAAKHAGALFVAQLTAAIYGVLTIAAVGDREFLGSAAAIKLPVVDVSVRTSIFFVALPILVIAVQVYYLFYHHLLLRLWRALEALRAQRSPVEHSAETRHLLRYPWIGLWVHGPGLAARFALVPFMTLSWLTAPLVLWVAWLKAKPFHSTVGLWAMDGAPSARVFAATFAIVYAALSLWLIYEDALERGVVEVSRVAVLSASLVAFAGLLVQVASVYEHRLELVNAEISRRPSSDSEDPRGAILPGVQLPGAKARRAYLALANLSDANLRSANLFGANLTEANLMGADLTGANLHGSIAKGANAAAASFADAFLGSSDWSNSGLACANLRNATMRGANFTLANLRGAVLVRAMIEQAIFDQADLRQADLSDAYVDAARFEGARYDESTLFPRNVVPPGAARAPALSPPLRCPPHP